MSDDSRVTMPGGPFALRGEASPSVPVPANMNALGELRALLRDMGFEIVPIGEAPAVEILMQALRPVLKEEIARAVAELQRALPPPPAGDVEVLVDLFPDGCE